MPLALRDTLSGGALSTALTAAQSERPFLIDGFVYERSSVLISGDPGSGKSVVTLCALAQASCGAPVFDQLPCVRPLNTYSLFSERVNQEAIERLKLMKERVPFDPDRMVLDDGFVGIADVTKQKFADEIIERIGKASYPDGRANLVNLDSLYGFIPGGLSKDEKASEFVRFTSRLQSELGVSLLMVHHTVKASYAQHTGEKIEKDDPFYGSQWLRAGATGSYYLRRDGDGVVMIRKKDTFGALLGELHLDYDPLTYCVSLSPEAGTRNAVDRAVFWLQMTAKTAPEKEFSFDDFCRALGLSHAHTRRIMGDRRVSSHLLVSKKVNLKMLYKAVV